jgi:hypothetical protein
MKLSLRIVITSSCPMFARRCKQLRSWDMSDFLELGQLSIPLYEMQCCSIMNISLHCHRSSGERFSGTIACQLGRFATTKSGQPFFESAR